MKLLLLIKMMARYVFDFTLANLVLAKQVLSPHMTLQSKVIEMDTEIEKPIEVLALSNLITFTPGTLTIEIDPGKKLSVHVLGTHPEDAGEQIQERLVEPLLQITRKRS